MKAQRSNINSSGRRSAHVKWDGKTIALGTFPELEAVEKCEQAKALTRKWRSTMVPKPDVEWVKSALERLNVRVVNDRPGRRRKEEVERDRNKASNNLLGPHMINGDEQMYGIPFGNADCSMLFTPQQQFVGSIPPTSHKIPMDYGMGGVSMSGQKRAFSSEDGPDMPQLHALQMGNNSLIGQAPFQPSFPMISARQIPGLDSPASCRQHYGVLKEHHDNLIRELEQTSYMMQMYQQNFQ